MLIDFVALQSGIFSPGSLVLLLLAVIIVLILSMFTVSSITTGMQLSREDREASRIKRIQERAKRMEIRAKNRLARK